MSLSSEQHKVAPVSGPLDYSLFAPAASLPVIEEDAAFEQCGEWSFIVELLNDILAEREARVEELQSAVQADDHTKLHKTAHAIKGAALNLHLPALVDVSKKSELLGKQLELSKDDSRLLQCRQPLIAALQTEYDRLQHYIPTAQEKADAELEGGGVEGTNDAYGDQQDDYDDYQQHPG